MTGRTLITAHSGAEGTAPNSLAFVCHALSLPVDALEVDVRLHPDGMPVLSHDALTPGEASYLSLQEVFEAIAGSEKNINCDLKEAGLEQQVCALAQRLGLSGRLILTGTVSAACMRESGLLKNTEVYLNIEEYLPDLYPRCQKDPGEIPAAAREMADICCRYGISCINTHHRLATEAFLSVLHDRGLSVSVWTVDEASRIRHFMRAGVRNITTRNPSVLAEVFGAHPSSSR